MKKKNGFTLVELLVVIALMLSILGIAIVSFVNISNKKKEESWKEVVNQIETAAKDYFSSNEYLFEGLPNNNGKAQISLGKLVNEDYLNVVSDPRSEKRVDKCAIVTVEKKDDKYNVELDEDSVTKPKTDCDLNLTVITSETGRIEDGYGSIAEEICKGENEEKYSYIDEEEKERICKCRDNPNLEECSNNNNNDDIYLKRLKKKCYNKNGDEILDPDNTSNGYCYRAKFTLNLENIKGSITSAKYCNSNNEECDLDKYGGKTVKFTNNTNISDEFEGYGDDMDDGFATDNAYTRVDVYNQSGALIRFALKDYKIDRIKPTVNISLQSSNEDYPTADPTIYIEGYDEHSGINRYENENFDSSDGDIPAEESVTLTNSIIYNSSGEVIEDFSGETTYPKVTIYDNVGNSSDSGDNTYYTVYKECTVTKPAKCEGPGYHGCDWGCTSYSKGKCTSTGYRDSCIDVHYYSKDMWSDNPCEPYPKCSPTPTKKSKKINAKAYKFSEEDKDVACKTKETVHFNCNRKKDANGNPIRCTIGGYYYRRYKFKELECSCTLSNKKITVNKINNITDSTHPNDYSYLFYDKKKNCEKQTKGNIVQICTHKYHQKLKFHGVKWYEKENSKWQYYTSKNGYWYNNSYTAPEKEGSSKVNTENEVCKWACESKAGIN